MFTVDLPPAPPATTAVFVDLDTREMEVDGNGLADDIALIRVFMDGSIIAEEQETPIQLGAPPDALWDGRPLAPGRRLPSRKAVAERGEKQRAYKSKHKYDLAKFNLDEARIREDCAFFYETFLPPLEKKEAAKA